MAWNENCMLMPFSDANIIKLQHGLESIWMPEMQGEMKDSKAFLSRLLMLK